jgi:hypothetical protein
MILASSDSLVDHLEKAWQRPNFAFLCWPQDTTVSKISWRDLFFAKKNWVASFITQLETDKEGQDPGAACKVWGFQHCA